MSDDLNFNQKKCPSCEKFCDLKDIRCPHCQHEFSDDDMQKKKAESENPRAPKKTCPQCGTKVYINRAYCDKCNHRFISKREKALLEQQKSASVKSTQERTGDRPIKALRNLSIALIAYGLILIIGLAVLARFVSPTWFAIISSGTVVISLGLGVGIGILFDGSYGRAPMTPFNIYCCIVIVAMILIDALYFIKGLSIYSGAMKWGMGAIAVSISVGTVTALITMRSQLKDTYCSHCGYTNVLFFSHDQNEKEIYGYKFETHKGHTETARISDDIYGDSNTYIRYKTPDYQENLGLHKTTTKEKVYVCEKCGRTVVRNSSITEKVGM